MKSTVSVSRIISASQPRPLRRRLKLRPPVLAFLILLLACGANAATLIWTVASGTDTNWFTGANWTNATAGTSGTAPAGTDNVKFYDLGAVAGVSNINNFVDTSFAGYIGSLQYANTNNNHTTLIAPNQTLNLTSSGGLTTGTLTDNGSAQIVNATITGPGGTLNLSNSAAVLYVSQGRAANGNGTQRATLDLTGLDTFLATANRIDVGTRQPGGTANAQNATGTLKLARTNIISLSYAPSAYNLTANSTNAIDIGENDGNNGGVDYFYLGQSNAFFLDGIAVGKAKTTGTMLFNPAFTSPTAYFRGTNGATSRVSFWSIADMQSTGSSSSFANGTNDFTGGTVDALVNVMSLGRDRSGGNTGSTATRGTLTFTSGTIDVNTLLVGNQAFSATGNSNPMAGVVNVNGPSARLVVNTSLVLGNTTANSTAAAATSGILNIRDGTVRANAISVGAYSTANNTITLTNGTLILTNTLGTPAKAVATFNVTNSTLQLNVSAANNNNVTVTNLVTGGATNIINPASVSVFPAYPTQLVLIKYSGSIGGAGYNFGFGASILPLTAPGAFLSNNVANKSIDLVLPDDPRPVITQQPTGYSGFPSNDLNLVVGVSAASATPLSYQWYLNTTTALTDGPTGSGSIIAGSVANSLYLTNAQMADSGNYTVVVTNLYGAATSLVAVLSISTNDIPPVITSIAPGASQTVIAGNNAAFTVLASGAPAPDYYWFDINNNLIAYATAPTLSLTNVQYADRGVYSLIVSNRAGTANTNLTLDVIVRPTISAQPQNVVVTNGNSASFSVTASGIPDPGYQWLKNGTPISGNASALTSNLTIAATSPSDIASYSVLVTNAAGSITSSNATLTVDSTMAAVALAPTNGATNVCYDTPLYITFDRTPSLRNAGQVRIYNVTNSAVPVDTLDLSANAANNTQSRSIAGEPFNTYPVIITGSTAAIYPHLGVLTSNQTYYVTVDSGVFTDSLGAYFAGITDPNAWTFATKPTGPANPTNLVVAADGSGDFTTVQGAADSVPMNNTTPTLVNVRNGDYVEIVNVKSKHNITLRGQSRGGTVVGYANNANITTSGSTHFRMAFKVNANDIAIENMTVTNRTPVGGSQAEALMLESTVKRFIFNNAALGSYQDTLLANGGGQSQAYFNNSLIMGQFDYLWGGGNCFFANCELRTLLGAGGSGSGNLVATRTDNGATGNWPGYLGLSVSNGFSFVKCRLTRLNNNVTNVTLAGSNGTTNGNAVWINCSIDTNCYKAPVTAAANSELLWEYGNSNLDNTVVTPPFTGVTQLTNDDQRLLAAQNATVWLNGWVPQLAPNILTNPANQSVAGGGTISLTVAATGIPAPAYQWLRNGTPLDGQTDATLTIANAHAGQAGTYSVVVSNVAGVVTSGNATVTVGNTSPTLGVIADQTVNVGVSVSIDVAALATDPDVPPQTLTFSLTSGPTNATIDPFTGAFSFRPLVSQAGAICPITVTVTDNGAGNLSASQSFSVIVNPLTQPDVSSPAWVGGQFSLTVNGQSGPDYAVQASTDLVNWQTVFTTNSPAMPFQWADPDTGTFPMRFYRIVVGPPLP